MSLIDELKKQLDNVLGTSLTEAGTGPATHTGGLIEHVFGMIKSQGMTSLTDQLTKSGLGEVVGSWVSKGKNLPISADQLKQALDSEQFQSLATKLGLPLDNAAEMLAKVLPGVVDKLTPEGVVDESTLNTGLSGDTSDWQQPVN